MELSFLLIPLFDYLNAGVHVVTVPFDISSDYQIDENHLYSIIRILL